MRFVAICLFAVVVALARAPAADACTCSPPHLETDFHWPRAGAVDVPSNAPVVMHVSDTLSGRPASGDDQADIVVTREGQDVEGTVEYPHATGLVVWRPTEPLVAGGAYVAEFKVYDVSEATSRFAATAEVAPETPSPLVAQTTVEAFVPDRGCPDELADVCCGCYDVDMSPGGWIRLRLTAARGPGALTPLGALRVRVGSDVPIPMPTLRRGMPGRDPKQRAPERMEAAARSAATRRDRPALFAGWCGADRSLRAATAPVALAAAAGAGCVVVVLRTVEEGVQRQRGQEHARSSVLVVGG